MLLAFVRASRSVQLPSPAVVLSAVVSMVIASAEDAGLVLPAASVAVAVISWAPSLRVEGIRVEP